MLGEHLCWLYCTTIGCHGWFTAYSSPSPLALADESDDGSGSDDADENDGASSPNDDEMTA